MSDTKHDQVVKVPVAEEASGLDRFFKISERGSTVRIEVLAGITTWLTMAYILFLNPQILGFAAVPDLQPLGLPFGAVLTVTALVAGVMTIAMGLWANYPFAIAAGLGLNAFVAFTLVAGEGLSYPEAMGVIVVEGLVITLLVLTGLRNTIVDAIPMDLKRAIAIGIGLFLAVIGLVNAGVVVRGEGTVVAMSGNLTTLRDPHVRDRAVVVLDPRRAEGPWRSADRDRRDHGDRRDHQRDLGRQRDLGCGRSGDRAGA